jgi:D-glycerate 3-kinase
MQVARLAGLEVDRRASDCFASLDEDAPIDYRQLAALLASEWHRNPPARVGLGGGQGAGKSTLGDLIETACAEVGLRSHVLSLDDFYLPKVERRSLAESVHPLFETRGPPGTHDMPLCAASLEALAGASEVRLPIFDKGLDDRIGERIENGPFDVVILEGWCVGARAVVESELVQPLNRLEAENDAEGTWRRAVNRALREEYEPVWESLEALVYLGVPSLDAVRRWRSQQEEARPIDLRMSAAEIDRFVQHYERITLRMLAAESSAFDWDIRLDEEHRIEAVSVRDD